MATIVDPYTAAPNAVIVAAEINARIAAILAQVNGNVDTANLKPSVLDAVGVTSATVPRRGKSIIATSQSRTNAAYGLMATPDVVPGIVLPTDGRIFVLFSATWQEAVAGAGRAAIFIGANQLKAINLDAGAPQVEEAATNGAVAGLDRLLATVPWGLVSGGPASPAYTGDVTTGQAVALSPTNTGFGSLVWMLGGSTVQAPNSFAAGGLCVVRAAAGTYDVSVQTKSASGSVTMKNRELHVWTMAGF